MALKAIAAGSTDLRVAAQDALSVWSRTARVAARAVARHTRARARPEMLAHESGGCHSEIWGQFRQSGAISGYSCVSFRSMILLATACCVCRLLVCHVL